MRVVFLTFFILLYFYTTAQSNNNLMSKSEKVKVEIWSDIVCPFCLIGKKKIEKAIYNLNAQDKTEIIWHSFQLDPDFPLNTAIPSIENLSEKKGYSISQINQMCEQLTFAGKEYGIDFQFNKALTFNTWDVHRLIQWSKSLKKSNKLKEAFMTAYFSEGIDLSDNENILNVVEKVELDVGKANQILESNSYAQEVKNDIIQSQQLGIRGVPYFLINEKESISGAQSDEAFESIISAALNNLKLNNKDAQDGICLPNGECK